MSPALLPDNAREPRPVRVNGRCNGVSAAWIESWLSQGWTSKMIAARVGVHNATIRKFCQIQGIRTARERAIASDPIEARYRRIGGAVAQSCEASP
jgi:hypothetical protein